MVHHGEPGRVHPQPTAQMALEPLLAQGQIPQLLPDGTVVGGGAGGAPLGASAGVSPGVSVGVPTFGLTSMGLRILSTLLRILVSLLAS